jgi:lipopolysaccharide/colanic/teichoic acid biosynthesis glycosyltransferase
MEAAVSNRQAVALSAPSESLEAPDWSANAGFALQLVQAHPTDTATLQWVDVRPREGSEAAIRVVNVIIALIGLVAASPLMVVVALFVKLTSCGPVLYSQTRVGVDRRYKRSDTDGRRVHDQGGKPFEMYKFRSMVIDSEADGRAVWAERKDPRATPIGRVLRRTRLDELPQLYNVIRGDMNIVGPRPERPTIFAELRQNIPQYHMRQRVRPGITGWAQVNQPYDACIDDVRRKVSYDLEYIRRQSVLEDLRIMLMTLPVMLFGQTGW